MNNEQESRNQLIGEFIIFAGIELLLVVAVANIFGVSYEIWKGI
jgi:hypothetical protein